MGRLGATRCNSVLPRVLLGVMGGPDGDRKRRVPAPAGLGGRRGARHRLGEHGTGRDRLRERPTQFGLAPGELLWTGQWNWVIGNNKVRHGKTLWSKHGEGGPIVRAREGVLTG